MFPYQQCSPYMATNISAVDIFPPASSLKPLYTLAPMNLADHLHEPSWNEILREEFEKPNFKELESLLTPKYSAGNVRPPEENIFKAFNLTPFDRVKVVILGQAPYPGDGQAMGLSFSVPKGISRIPQSLDNIYKELERDPNIEFSRPNHGNLEYWAVQGVLLLNIELTVETEDPNSDVKCGWKAFTDNVIYHIDNKCSGVVFMLLGKSTHKKEDQIDENKHRVIKTSDPSSEAGSDGMVPLFGSNCFTVCNADLRQFGRLPVNWYLPKNI